MIVSELMPAFESVNHDLYNSILRQINDIEQEFSNYKVFYSLDKFNQNIEEMTSIMNSCEFLYEYLETIKKFEL